MYIASELASASRVAVLGLSIVSWGKNNATEHNEPHEFHLSSRHAQFLLLGT